MEDHGTGRRAVLKGGLALAAGAIGFGGLGKAAHASVLDSTIVVRAARLHAAGADGFPNDGERTYTRGDIVGPDGARHGEFVASAIWPAAPSPEDAASIVSLEVHGFNLEDGTIMGMGVTSSQLGEEGTFAIAGGTGRYAGIAGTYTARIEPLEFGGDGTAEFTMQIQGLTSQALGGPNGPVGG